MKCLIRLARVIRFSYQPSGGRGGEVEMKMKARRCSG